MTAAPDKDGLTAEGKKPDSRLLVIAAATVAVVVILAYLTSFGGVFQFDDYDWITKAAAPIHRLWPPWRALFSPSTVDRPLLGLSLAFNYWISGLNPWSYHAFNLLIHVLAALTVFGIVRRTLSMERLAPVFGQHATALALLIALLWGVHPLGTQAVTYVVQRCESMMGLFYLAALYFAIRGMTSGRPGRWYCAAACSAAAGALSKQVIVTAPIVILLYDYTFVSESLRGAITRHLKLYAGLTLSWVFLAATVIESPRSSTAGFAVRSVGPLLYFVSEFKVIVHYVKLSIWPHPLCLDYAWPVAKGPGDVIPYGLIVGATFALTAWGVARRNPAGFVGAWFFLILGVSSSILPIADLAVEHRMYLPLLSIVIIVVLATYRYGRLAIERTRATEAGTGSGYEMGRSVALAAGTAAVLVLGFATAERNIAYQSEVVMWLDVVHQRPSNARAHMNLGVAYAGLERLDDAISQFQQAVALNPMYADPETRLGWALSRKGDLDGAFAHLSRALKLDAKNATPHRYMAILAIKRGNGAEAIDQLEQAHRLAPDDPETCIWLAQALARQGRTAEATAQYQAALDLRPDWADKIAFLASQK